MQILSRTCHNTQQCPRQSQPVEIFPSKILILKKIHRSSFGRLGRSGCSRLGRSGSSRDGRVQVKYLDGRLLRRSRRDNRIGLDTSRLRRPMLRLLVTLMTWKISQVNHVGQSLPLVSSNWARLRLVLWHGLLVRLALPLVFFHSCYPCKEKKMLELG